MWTCGTSCPAVAPSARYRLIPSLATGDARVLSRLEETGHVIVRLDYAQLEAFAGNMLELVNASGESRCLSMARFKGRAQARYIGFRFNGAVLFLVFVLLLQVQLPGGLIL